MVSSSKDKIPCFNKKDSYDNGQNYSFSMERCRKPIKQRMSTEKTYDLK